MITMADVSEIEGGLKLQQDNASLYLWIPSEVPYEVKVLSLDPPPLDYDKKIEGLKRLEIHWNRDDFPEDGATLQIELDSKSF